MPPKETKDTHSILSNDELAKQIRRTIRSFRNIDSQAKELQQTAKNLSDEVKATNPMTQKLRKRLTDHLFEAKKFRDYLIGRTEFYMKQYQIPQYAHQQKEIFQLFLHANQLACTVCTNTINWLTQCQKHINGEYKIEFEFTRCKLWVAGIDRYQTYSSLIIDLRHPYHTQYHMIDEFCNRALYMPVLTYNSALRQEISAFSGSFLQTMLRNLSGTSQNPSAPSTCSASSSSSSSSPSSSSTTLALQHLSAHPVTDPNLKPADNAIKQTEMPTHQQPIEKRLSPGDSIFDQLDDIVSNTQYNLRSHATKRSRQTTPSTQVITTLPPASTKEAAASQHAEPAPQQLSQQSETSRGSAKKAKLAIKEKNSQSSKGSQSSNNSIFLPLPFIPGSYPELDSQAAQPAHPIFTPTPTPSPPK